MSTSAARRRVLRTLIADRPIRSQAELVALLAGSGFAVTQATVSRDLQVIGAVKAEDDRYVLGERPEPGDALAALSRAIDEFVESIEATGNLVVLRTPPGAAQVVAGAIDRAGLEGVAGSVAGDDTILVATSEGTSGTSVARRLEEIGAEE